MNKFVKVLERRGRITIPAEIRKKLGYEKNDILSFTPCEDGIIIIRRETIEENKESGLESTKMLKMFEAMSDKAQRDFLAALTVRWAERRTADGK